MRGVKRRLDAFAETVYAEFCVSTPVPLQEILNRFIKEFEQGDSEATGSARDIVYPALRRRYASDVQRE
ncbi:MAG: hypothetical protein PVH89_05865 [Gammaproteobacteria bacterium]|jgi:hypothetical protein